MNASMAASAVRTTGRARWTVASTTATRPSGAVANTIAIAEIDRTWKMIAINMRAIMMGNSGAIARLALPARRRDRRPRGRKTVMRELDEDLFGLLAEDVHLLDARYVKQPLA